MEITPITPEEEERIYNLKEADSKDLDDLDGLINGMEQHE